MAVTRPPIPAAEAAKRTMYPLRMVGNDYASGMPCNSTRTEISG